MAKTERSGHTTTDHDFIRQWVEERGGWPARVKGTQRGSDDAGLLRIDFPGYSGQDRLERIDWDDWFQGFDENQLALLHRDMRHGDGDLDRFNKLVTRDGSEGSGSRSSRGRSTAKKSSTASKSSRSSGNAAAKRTTTRASSSSKTAADAAKSSSTGSRSRSGSARKSASASNGATKRSAASKSAGATKRSTTTRSSSSTRSSSARTAANGTSSRSTASRSRRANSEMSEIRDLLLHEMGDMLYAERRFLTATRTMAKEAQDPQIKARVEEHARETEVQIERIQDAFRAVGERPRAVKCEGAIGLKEEHDSFRSERPTPEILSAFDLGSGLRVEHYEIAGYRSAIAVAKALGERECASLLEENLKEEMAMASFLEKNAPLALRKIRAEELASEGGRSMIDTIRHAVGI